MKKLLPSLIFFLSLLFLISCQRNVKKAIDNTVHTMESDSMPDTVVTLPQDHTVTDTSDVVKSLRQQEKFDSIEMAKEKAKKKHK
jgi:mannose-1-phosphate guanylyltransferase